MNSKAIYIGLGILLGLAIAYIGYSYLQNIELSKTVESQTTEIQSMQKKVDSLNATINDLKVDLTKKEADLTSSEKEEPEIETKVSEEDLLWDVTKQSNTFEAYINYLSHAKSKNTYLIEATQKLEELGKKGWLYAGRTNDNSTFSEDQIAEVVWRNSDENTLNRAVPKVGDVLLLKTSTSRRTYSNYSPRESQNGAWQMDQKAYVIEVKMEGPTAIIIKIAYK